MSQHFVLQQNQDGSMSLEKKNQVLAEVCGKVNYINKKNRKLFSIHAEKMNRKFRCVLSYNNPFLPIKEGDAIFALAEYVKDSRYGDTLNILHPPFVVLGEDKNTVIKSFSTALRGTGFSNAKAHSLIEVLVMKTGSLENGIKTLDRLASFYNYKNMSDSSIVNGYSSVIKEKQMIKLLKWWYKNRNLRKLYLLGFNNREIKSCKMDPIDIYMTCLDNPYKLYPISMDKCEDILDRIGKNVDNETKKCGEITRKLYECMEKKGWSGVPSGILSKMITDCHLLMDKLRSDFDVKTELHTIYLPYPHEVEIGITNLVADLVDSPSLPHCLRDSEIEYTRSDLTKDQKEAVKGSLQKNISIIRGIAGSGKTTVIKEIIHNLDSNNIKYRVVSFTGKAVARIREVIDKKEPMTMHMTITLSNKAKSGDFAHLIIDEASMVTSELLYEFTQKFNHPYRITLIGDPNQLTPIGWGTLFDQVIKSNLVPTYTLTVCHRVDGLENGILLNSNTIVECAEPGYNGPPFEYEETGNFNIVDGNLEVVKQLIKILQDNGTNSDKITVICPYNKYLKEINKICQDIYNNMKRCVHDGDTIWRIGDRVMMTENNYKYNLMNGDEGKITDLTADQIQVTFKDGSYHIFFLSVFQNNNYTDSNNTNKILSTSSIIHSFGVSVHRYQGSECDYVIFYIPESAPSKFLNRNLLYTGITRAKKIIWMVGNYDTMVRAATTPPPYRCDNLSARIKNSRVLSLEQ